MVKFIVKMDTYFVPYGVNIFDATLDSISRIRNLTLNYQWLYRKICCDITSRGVQIRFVIIKDKLVFST